MYDLSLVGAQPGVGLVSATSQLKEILCGQTVLQKATLTGRQENQMTEVEEKTARTSVIQESGMITHAALKCLSFASTKMNESL